MSKLPPPMPSRVPPPVMPVMPAMPAPKDRGWFKSPWYTRVLVIVACIGTLCPWVSASKTLSAGTYMGKQYEAESQYVYRVGVESGIGLATCLFLLAMLIASFFLRFIKPYAVRVVIAGVPLLVCTVLSLWCMFDPNMGLPADARTESARSFMDKYGNAKFSYGGVQGSFSFGADFGVWITLIAAAVALGLVFRARWRRSR